MKYFLKVSGTAVVFLCLLRNDAFTQPLQAYFERLYPAQPNVRNGGMTVCVAVNPDNNNEIIAATHTGGLMKTTDHCANWLTLFNLPPHIVTFVEYAPMNTRNVIAATRDIYSTVDLGGIWLSPDGGDTWNRPVISPGFIFPFGARFEAYCIASFPGSRRIMVGTSQGLAISDDDGQTFAYSNVPGTSVYAVALMRENKMLIGTNSGIYYWNATTATWNHERSGIGTAFGYNSFHVPKQFMADVTTSNPIFVVTSSGSIQFSNNGGRNWNLADTFPAPLSGSAKGTSFVRVAKAHSGRVGIDLYFSNLYGIYRKFCPRTGPDFSYAFNEHWEGMLEMSHSDVSDLSLDRDGNPFLMGGDGGIQKYEVGPPRDHFSFVGGGYSSNGFHGLQVTEVTGMYVNSRSRYDIYFGTQDNNLFASEDGGINWNFLAQHEGFFLEHAKRVANEDDAKVAFVSCWPCGKKFSRRLFREARNYSTPAARNPGALKYFNTNTWLTYAYIDNAPPWQAATLASTTFWYTNNYNTVESTPTWTSLGPLPYFVPRYLPRLSGSGSDQVLYQAYKTVSDPGDDDGGPTGSGIQRVKLMRMQLSITPYSFYSAPRYPAMRNFGSIGSFLTNFAMYEMFAPDPRNPQHIIAADALNNKMMRSLNGGDDWFEMTQLTDLVTASGSLKFKVGRLTNVSCISFNPENTQMVLVGTKDAGIFFSWNNGVNWEKIPGSEKIPEVSSFFFENNNKVWVASYGRGLWKMEFSFRARRSFLSTTCANGQCTLLINPGLLTTFMHLEGAGNGEEFEQAMMVTGGSITGMVVNSGIVESVLYTPDASVVWYTDDKKVNVPFKMTSENTLINGFTGIDKIEDLVKQGFVIKGILLKGNQLIDIIYGKEPALFPDDAKKIEYVEVGAKEPGIKGKPFIVLYSESMMNGYCTVKKGDKMFLKGLSYDKNSPSPLLVYVDDIPSANIKLEKMDADGNFYVEFLADFALGYHTITVTHYTAEKKLISQTDEFMVTHTDEEQSQQTQEQKSSQKPPQKQPAIKEKAAELKNEIEKIVNPKKNNKGE